MDILDALSRAVGRDPHITTRHEQGAAFMADVYGRLTGPRRRRDGDARAGRDEPRDRHRRRLPRPRADGRDHRPGGLGQAAQGGAPVRRHRRHVRAGDEVEPARRATSAPSPRSCARRSGSPSWRSPARPTSSCPRTSPRTRASDDRCAPLEPTRAYFPEPTDEAIAHAARLLGGSERPIILAGNGVLRRHAVGRAAGVRQGPPRARRGHVHGQGRDRRPRATSRSWPSASRRATTS